MGYSIFRFGSLYLESIARNVPQKPTVHGDIPSYRTIPHTHPNNPQVSIGSTSVTDSKVISWIKPDGMNLLVADRVLLTDVSWWELNDLGFITGKTTTIDGHTFLCRLLKVGVNKDVANEWDDILTETSKRDLLWHWDDIYFWGADESAYEAPVRVVCGHSSAGHRSYANASYQYPHIGLRPVLEPLPSDAPTPNISLDGVDFQLTSLPGGKGFCPILQPIQGDVFKNIPAGGKVRMYTFMDSQRPIHIGEPIKETTKLTLTDRYYGDEFLVPWTISNGVAVASTSLTL